MSTSALPIGPYERRAAVVRPWDPRMLAAADRVIELVHGVLPGLRIEHIGSTAVPGLAGKGILDLGTETDAAEIPAVTEALFGLGFGPQPGPNAWPPTRPMHVGSIAYAGEQYRIHFHVHPRGSGDFAKDIRFRDALREDARLRGGYADVKQEIVGPAGGPVDPIRYQQEKGVWILETFDALGIQRPVHVQFADVAEADPVVVDEEATPGDTNTGEATPTRR